jgi:hypothetical protein
LEGGVSQLALGRVFTEVDAAHQVADGGGSRVNYAVGEAEAPVDLLPEVVR